MKENSHSPDRGTMIRSYQPMDIHSIKSIGREVISQSDLFPFEDIQGVVDYWFSSGSVCYVVEEAGEVLGSYVLKPNVPDRGSHVANAGYMVRQSARGKGLGRQLADHSIRTAKDLGYQAMQFNIVVASNHSAINLWKSMGFSTVGTVPAAFRVSENQFVDLHIMHRSL